MWIKRIALANWRAYGQATFDIPRSNPRENVVVIGAKNGVGKTSLLQAVTLGLFGVSGIDNIVRQNNGGPKTRYNEFLRSAHHKLADTSFPKSSVSIIFEMDDGEEISVNRVWHFGVNGECRDEDIRIQKNGEDLTIPALEDREEFIAGEITRRFIPASLLPFFLFDSVRVQQLAGHDMQDQVKDGIERTLGIPIMRLLISDLHTYASAKRRLAMSDGASDGKLERLEQGINQCESEVAQLTKNVEMRAQDLAHAKSEEDSLVKEFEGMGGEEVAAIGGLIEQLSNLKNERQGLRSKMAEMLVGNFAMSLVGQKLLQSTVHRLHKESARTEWERDKNSGGEKYVKFSANFAQLPPLTPPLTEEQSSQLDERLRQAWYDVYHPMPAKCASQFLNPGFSGEERTAAIAHLEFLSECTTADIKKVSQKIAEADAGIRTLEMKINAVRGDKSEAAKRIKAQMAEKREKITQLEKERGNHERELQAKKQNLAQLRQEFGREGERVQGKAPIMRRSILAENVATMVDDIINETYSQRVSAIAKEMTRAYTAMSRKKVVTKIEISDDCNIKLLTGRGKNIRELPLSHGESQIFTLSLIAAIARVSNNRFPFIIDTPLSNLDIHHRDEFLRFFSSDVDNQVIFLSTDTEIGNERMSHISHRLAAKFLVEQKQIDDVGSNVVLPNQYFEETE